MDEEYTVIPKGFAAFFEGCERQMWPWFDFDPEYGEIIARSLAYEYKKNFPNREQGLLLANTV